MLDLIMGVLVLLAAWSLLPSRSSASLWRSSHVCAVHCACRRQSASVGCSTLNLAAAPVDGIGWTAMRGTLQCEPPNADLHVFKGRFDVVPQGAQMTKQDGMVAVHIVAPDTELSHALLLTASCDAIPAFAGLLPGSVASSPTCSSTTTCHVGLHIA